MKILENLVKIHNENFEKTVKAEYFSEMILSKQYAIYCLFDFIDESEVKIFKIFKVENLVFEKKIKKILGYIIFYGTIENTDIFEIVILKSCQNKGFGKILLENSIKELFFSKIKNDSSDEINFFGEDIFLEVYEKNLFAIKLYEKIGFEKISVRKNYYGQNKNAIIMMLKKLK
mgnify:FL=1